MKIDIKKIHEDVKKIILSTIDESEFDLTLSEEQAKILLQRLNSDIDNYFNYINNDDKEVY